MANVRNQIIKEEPASYEAFVYRWTNLEKNKIYIGYHTGFIGDGYKHSGQCEDFNEDFQNENYQWDYEVLDYGTTNEMKNLERDLLKAAEARNSDEYYNQTNAGSAYFHVNTITSKMLVDDINDKKYLVKDAKIKKDSFQELLQTRIQVRVEDNKEAVKHISNEIDDAGGTKNCDSITLLENKLGDGKHQLLDGSTTMMGTLASKHGMYLTYNLIPEEVHKKFNDTSLREVALLLNPKQKKKKWESNDSDLVEHIMFKYQQKNEPIKSKENRKFLQEDGLIDQLPEKDRQYFIMPDSDAIKYSRLFGVTLWEVSQVEKDFNQEIRDAMRSGADADDIKFLSFKKGVYRDCVAYNDDVLIPAFSLLDAIVGKVRPFVS
jgi:hypothetical protein